MKSSQSPLTQIAVQDRTSIDLDSIKPPSPSPPLQPPASPIFKNSNKKPPPIVAAAPATSSSTSYKSSSSSTSSSTTNSARSTKPIGSSSSGFRFNNNSISSSGSSNSNSGSRGIGGTSSESITIDEDDVEETAAVAKDISPKSHNYEGIRKFKVLYVKMDAQTVGAQYIDFLNDGMTFVDSSSQNRLTYTLKYGDIDSVTVNESKKEMVLTVSRYYYKGRVEDSVKMHVLFCFGIQPSFLRDYKALFGALNIDYLNEPGNKNKDNDDQSDVTTTTPSSGFSQSMYDTAPKTTKRLTGINSAASSRPIPKVIESGYDRPSLAYVEKKQKPIKFVREDDTMIVYPPPSIAGEKPAGQVTIIRNDMKRLDNGEFLNDSIIEFYSRYIKDHYLSPKNTFFFFNSFFYKKFTDKDDVREAYKEVRKWCTEDLFSKDFVFVPINQRLLKYLTLEWEHKKLGIEKPDGTNDCGVFLLHYIELFCKKPETDFTLPLEKPGWFTVADITRKRKQIRSLIYKLRKEADDKAYTEEEENELEIIVKRGEIEKDTGPLDSSSLEILDHSAIMELEKQLLDEKIKQSETEDMLQQIKLCEQREKESKEEEEEKKDVDMKDIKTGSSPESSPPPPVQKKRAKKEKIVAPPVPNKRARNNRVQDSDEEEEDHEEESVEQRHTHTPRVICFGSELIDQRRDKIHHAQISAIIKIQK
eukprot:gene4981-5794_t